MTTYSTLDAAFRGTVERLSDRIALVDGTTRVTYRELDDRVARAAGGLLALGIRKGDRIAVWLPNSIEWAVAFFAAARVGAVVVPINTGLSVAEAQYILVQSGARTL